MYVVFTSVQRERERERERERDGEDSYSAAVMQGLLPPVAVLGWVWLCEDR